MSNMTSPSRSLKTYYFWAYLALSNRILSIYMHTGSENYLFLLLKLMHLEFDINGRTLGSKYCNNVVKWDFFKYTVYLKRAVPMWSFSAEPFIFFYSRTHLGAPEEQKIAENKPGKPFIHSSAETYLHNKFLLLNWWRCYVSTKIVSITVEGLYKEEVF